jgi:SAM-dependent methyltransferase
MIVPLSAAVLFPILQILYSGVSFFVSFGLLPFTILALFGVLQFRTAIKMGRGSLFDESEDRPAPNIGFRMMAYILKKRESSRRPRKRLEKIGIRKGEVVLDYGCGIGSYSIPAAEIVGESGKVYAIDIHPLAIKRVKKRAEENGLSNVTTILTHTPTGLDDASVDWVLLYDVLHMVKGRAALLQELYRVLKPSGTLHLEADHMTDEQVKSIFSEEELFLEMEDGCEGHLFSFKKIVDIELIHV